MMKKITLMELMCILGRPLSLPSYFHPCFGKHGWTWSSSHTLNFLQVSPLFFLCMSNVDCTVQYRSRPPTRKTDNNAPSSLLPFSSENNFCLYWWEEEMDIFPFPCTSSLTRCQALFLIPLPSQHEQQYIPVSLPMTTLATLWWKYLHGAVLAVATSKNY